jgi:hypothetical protein
LQNNVFDDWVTEKNGVWYQQAEEKVEAKGKVPVKQAKSIFIRKLTGFKINALTPVS